MEENLPRVDLFTDGACLNNPGPGGWALILRHLDTGKEARVSGGEERTTNNRMEVRGAIEGLRMLKSRCRVRLVSDSQYLTNSIKLWLKGWQRAGFRRKGVEIPNADLWRELVPLLAAHEVTAEWVRGHRGHAENEVCDQLATQAAAAWKRGEGYDRKEERE